jgi:hypothetical protein
VYLIKVQHTNHPTLKEEPQMTTRGYAFKDIAEYIVSMHGFGSRKTKEVSHSVLNPRCGFNYTLEDVNWLVDNGYLFHYVWNGTKGSKQSWGGWNARDHHVYGLTKKGWEVAPLYLKKTQS